LITDRLLHIHVFRTGGFLLRGVLLNVSGLTVYDSALHREYPTMAEMALSFLDRVPPAVAFVRNPWIWYVSMWSYTLLYRTPPHQTTFGEYMSMIVEDSSDLDYVRFSDHWESMGANKAQYIGRFEDLYHDIERILTLMIPDLVTGKRIRELMAMEPRHHASQPWKAKGTVLDYERFYTDELRETVKEWDGELIERFGYEFA
jgi:hypothetical protein